MIEKLDTSPWTEASIMEIREKINEIIEKLNDDPNDDSYKCTQCGCDPDQRCEECKK
jgi:hypothetical protein